MGAVGVFSRASGVPDAPISASDQEKNRLTPLKLSRRSLSGLNFCHGPWQFSAACRPKPFPPSSPQSSCRASQTSHVFLLLRVPVRVIDLEGLAAGEPFEQERVDALRVRVRQR